MSAEVQGAGTDVAAPRNHVFEADVAKLLHLMVHSVYSDKDVFLRELISNAADACDKLRHMTLITPELAEGASEFRIEITPNKKAKTIAIADNGIGMNRDELITNLGTIAKSGTSEFLKAVAIERQAEIRSKLQSAAQDGSSDQEA